MAANTVAIAVRPERHKRLRRGEKIAHPGRMDSGIAPTDHSALMVAHQDSQLHRNRLAITTCLCLKGVTMRRLFTLEYWRDGEWYVGRLMEVPGVFSQGKSLDELRGNIQEAYELMVTQDRTAAPSIAERQDVELEV